MDKRIRETRNASGQNHMFVNFHIGHGGILTAKAAFIPPFAAPKQGELGKAGIAVTKQPPQKICVATGNSRQYPVSGLRSVSPRPVLESGFRLHRSAIPNHEPEADGPSPTGVFSAIPPGSGIARPWRRKSAQSQAWHRYSENRRCKLQLRHVALPDTRADFSLHSELRRSR